MSSGNHSLKAYCFASGQKVRSSARSMDARASALIGLALVTTRPSGDHVGLSTVGVRDAMILRCVLVLRRRGCMTM